MARVRASLERAAAMHRQASAAADVAGQALDHFTPDATPAQQYTAQHELAAALRAAAAGLVPGWLGAPLEAFPALSPLPVPGLADVTPRFVRVGMAQPLDDARFPAVVPLLGAGHLAINGDARDPRVAGLLTTLVLRLVAASPAGELKVLAVDSTGSIFGAFAPLIPAGVLAEPATDRAGFRAVLSEAEQWVRNPGRYTLLVVIAALPELTEGPELARLAMLAQSGPAARLHLVVAGWPPPPLTADTTQPPLAATTQITLRNPHAIVGDPPGASFGSRAALNCPVYLDSAPPPETIRRVCQSVAEQVVSNTPTLRDLLPESLWQNSSADGLAVDAGEAGSHPVTLRLADLTPHWLIGGRSGAGKTAFLINVLYSLAARYSPAELTLYLLDFKEGVSFTEFTPTVRDPSWIPQARAVGIESDREYGLAVLRELDAEMSRRGEAFKQAGVSRFVDLRASTPSPRIVCVIDEFQVLVQGNDRLARDAVALLESLARKGRSYGIHLILASQTVRGVESLYAKRDSIFGQFPVRVALPGGGDVLDPLNQAADALGLGHAVVNTAGGLGGPNGVNRAHERMISFPDPHADPVALSTLRHRLWQARPEGSQPPYVFAGYADQYLPEAVPATSRPVAYLGRAIDVPLSLAGYPLDTSPGRHLAILSPGPGGAAVLAAAARSLGLQHKPGTVRFAVAGLVESTEAVVTRTVKELRAAGHQVSEVDGAGLHKLAADPELAGAYLVGFGLDAAPGGVDLRPVLRDGPARRTHLLGWWRGLRRFADDTGGSSAREDVAGLVLLDIPATDAALLTSDATLDWQPRANRALLYDRHAGRAEVFVPFTEPGHLT